MHLLYAWSVIFTVAFHSCWTVVDAQSNYAERGVDIEYQGNGIPQEATLDGIVTKLDDLTNIIRTNRCLIQLNKKICWFYNSQLTLYYFVQDGGQLELRLTSHGSGFGI